MKRFMRRGEAGSDVRKFQSPWEREVLGTVLGYKTVPTRSARQMIFSPRVPGSEDARRMRGWTLPYLLSAGPAPMICGLTTIQLRTANFFLDRRISFLPPFQVSRGCAYLKKSGQVFALRPALGSLRTEG